MTAAAAVAAAGEETASTTIGSLSFVRSNAHLDYFPAVEGSGNYLASFANPMRDLAAMKVETKPPARRD